MHKDARQLNKEQARKYVVGGDAKFTVVSKKTGTRFTYQATNKWIRTPKGGWKLDRTSPIFVKLLTGPVNTKDYTFFGTLFGKESFKHSPNSSIGDQAPSAKAFRWVWWLLSNPEVQELPDTLEFWSSGRCCCCDRELTDPVSVAAGMGPKCALTHFGIKLNKKKGGK